MRKRFSEEQIIGFLREADQGVAVKDLCRRHGFSEASYYLWRSKSGGMDVSDAKRLKAPGSRERSAQEATGRVDARGIPPQIIGADVIHDQTTSAIAKIQERYDDAHTRALSIICIHTGSPD